MILINKNTNFENLSFEEAKKDLQELYEYSSIFEELENNAFSEEDQNNDFIKAKLLISEIKEKQGITDSLTNLVYNVGWLRSSIIIKDETIRDIAISNILKHRTSSINALVAELNSLRTKIDEFEDLHMKLLKSSLSLDTKTLLEQDFREKQGRLNDLHKKQKNVLLNLSNIFVKLTKDFIIKKNK